MELSLLKQLAIIIITFFAALTQGTTGFGSAIVAMPFYVGLIPPKEAVSLTILNGIFITSILTLRHRNDIKAKNVLPLILGSIPGIIIGIIFIHHASSLIIRRLLGYIIASYAVYSLINPDFTIKGLKRRWGYLAGLLTGAIGASIGAGGPPTIIYVTLSGWKKDEIKGTLVGFFLISGVIIAFAHFFSGITTWWIIRLFILNLPFLALGSYIGMSVYNKFPQQLYLKTVLVLLFIMGLLLILSR